MLKIDVFAHISTPAYLKRYIELVPEIGKRSEAYKRTMHDIDVRENLMRRHPDILQIITMGNIPLEYYASPKDAVELAKIGNDELAELVKQKPGLFYGTVGMLPLNDIPASLEMIDYCLRDLHMLGIQLYTSHEREPLSEPKYRPIFAKVAEYDKAVWIHPSSSLDIDRGMFSWPYDSSSCMFNLVRSGIYDEFPDLKIIIHHAGAMVPFLKERVKTIMAFIGRKRAADHFKKFYVDTAIYGNTAGLMSTYDFFGASHMLFGTDSPLGAPQGSNGDTDCTLSAVEKMNIPEAEKEMILRDNAMNLFGILI